MRDLYSDISAIPAFAPAVQSAAVDGAAIDLKDVGAIAFVLNTGAIVSSGAFGAKIQESDNGSTGWADVTADQVQTNAPATLLAASTYRLGYLGYKRYVRLVLTKASGTSIAASATAILHTYKRPVA